MTEQERAEYLARRFDKEGQITKESIQLAILCCNEIMILDALTDEAWLNVPDTYKVQYWKCVANELATMLNTLI